ncbi:MAG: four-helix bundle copper-binding protein [Ferruginibacter sp.]
MEYRDLIEQLSECAMVCNHCASACLQEKNVEMLSACIRLDLDCADICTLAARMLARGSQHGIHLLTECREICFACAEECERHSHMEHCEKCAEACRSCAELCAEEIAP